MTTGARFYFISIKCPSQGSVCSSAVALKTGPNVVPPSKNIESISGNGWIQFVQSFHLSLKKTCKHNGNGSSHRRDGEASSVILCKENQDESRRL